MTRHCGDAHKAPAATYTFTEADFAKVAMYSPAASSMFAPCSIALNPVGVACKLDRQPEKRCQSFECIA